MSCSTSDHRSYRIAGYTPLFFLQKGSQYADVTPISFHVFISDESGSDRHGGPCRKVIYLVNKMHVQREDFMALLQLVVT